jgi:hypothetical protein
MGNPYVRYYTTSFSTFGYLSHLPIISAACLVTIGPVLELGAGFGSTFALHGICGVSKRKIVTVESDGNWLAQFQYYKRPWHDFRYVTSFIDLPEYQEKWGLAFVDHGILGERGLALAAVKDVPIVVAHDTCHEQLNYTNKGVPQPLRGFRYRFDYQWFGPQTSVLSNTIDVFNQFKELGL